MQRESVFHSHLPSYSSDLPPDAVKRLQFNAKAAAAAKGWEMFLKQVQTRQLAAQMQPRRADGAVAEALVGSSPAVSAPLASAAVSTETMATRVARWATSGRELEGSIKKRR